MPTELNARRIVFTGKQAVSLEPADIPAPAGAQVLVKTSVSLMSTGTENIVFNRNFDLGTHWDNWVRYPFYPGYTSVGEIIATGPDATQLKVGQRVACRYPHASHSMAKAADCFPIPDGLADEEAVWFALAKIAFHGALSGGFGLGSRILVIGAGPIGQMSMRWAAASGAANVVVADMAADRLRLALEGGASAVIDRPVGEARQAVLDAMGGELPDIVVDSTGNAAVFAQAQKLTRNFGRIVVLGDTGSPAQQSLTSDVISRGLTIVGAHDNHTTSRWTPHTIIDLFFRLAGSGRFPLKNLISHTFTPDQCVEAYDTANRHRSATMGILFNWR